jgi:hypothetical protein
MDKAINNNFNKAINASNVCTLPNEMPFSLQENYYENYYVPRKTYKESFNRTQLN